MIIVILNDGELKVHSLMQLCLADMNTSSLSLPPKEGMSRRWLHIWIDLWYLDSILMPILLSKRDSRNQHTPDMVSNLFTQCAHSRQFLSFMMCLRQDLSRYCVMQMRSINLLLIAATMPLPRVYALYHPHN